MPRTHRDVRCSVRLLLQAVRIDALVSAGQKNMHPEGFEPSHPEILRLECSALDHSATDAHKKNDASYADRTHDLQIFSLALSQLSSKISVFGRGNPRQR